MNVEKLIEHGAALDLIVIHTVQNDKHEQLFMCVKQDGVPPFNFETNTAIKKVIMSFWIGDRRERFEMKPEQFLKMTKEDLNHLLTIRDEGDEQALFYQRQVVMTRDTTRAFVFDAIEEFGGEQQ